MSSSSPHNGHAAGKEPFRLQGLCAAVYTPFSADGKVVALDKIPLHAHALLQQGVKYAFVCGTTGEGGAMTVSERKSVLEAWIAAARPVGISVLAHVGAENIPDVLDLATHAEAAGAVAIAVMPPVFFKPLELASVTSLLAQVSAAAPHTPLYFYHFPERTGVAINIVALFRRLDNEDAGKVPTFRGAKFTDHDLGTFAAAVAYGAGKYDVLSGRDASFIGAQALGGTGAVGSTWNYVGLLGNQMIAAVKRGDLATARGFARAAARVADIVASPAKYGGVSVNVHKAVMEARIGITSEACGPARPPAAIPMPASARQALIKDLEDAGFWQAPMTRGATLVHSLQPQGVKSAGTPPPLPAVLPWVGLGTWKSAPGAVAAAVTAALEMGYTHIDCAAAYGNEAEVGAAVADAIARGVVKREDLFITSKLWVSSARPDAVAGALKKSLQDLQLDYLDLYLVHWPFSIDPKTPFPPPAEDIVKYSPSAYAAVWAAMEDEALAGRTRAIGCSNMSVSKLEALTSSPSIRVWPAVNQVESHPFLPQTELLQWCKSRGIVLTAYSPLGSPDRPARLVKEGDPAPMGHDVVAEVAKSAGITPAQTLLRWQLQRGVVVIPKSVTPSRIRENLSSQWIEPLGKSAMGALGALEAPNGAGRIIKGYPSKGETLEEFWA